MIRPDNCPPSIRREIRFNPETHLQPSCSALTGLFRLFAVAFLVWVRTVHF
jgi:hypothetical protein